MLPDRTAIVLLLVILCVSSCVGAGKFGRSQKYDNQGNRITLTEEEVQFFDAVEVDDIVAFRGGIEAGLDPETLENEDGDFAFFMAASHGSTKILDHFLDELNYDVDLRDRENVTAFLLAAWHGHKEMVLNLAKRGSDIHARCTNGWNAVIGAVRWEEYDTVKLLHEELGINLHHTEKEGEWSSLMIATAQGNYDIAKYLVDHGVEVDHADSKGRTAQTIASDTGNIEIEELISAKLNEPKPEAPTTNKHQEL